MRHYVDGILSTIVRAALVFILLLPTIVYIATFGMTISANHSRWGEMGSAMSGIYSPIFSLLALIVLIAQSRAQTQINKHQFDQSYIAETRSDIQYYLEQLDNSLNVEIQPNVALREFIKNNFTHITPQFLSSDELRSLAQDLNRNYPRLFAVWGAIYAILAGLSAVRQNPYEHNFSVAKQKIIVIVSFEICVALDNFHWCLTEGKVDVKYQFSPDIEKRRNLGGVSPLT